MAKAKNLLSTEEQDIASLQETASKLNSDIQGLTNDYVSLKTSNDELTTKYSSLKTDYANATNGYAYVLRDPSYSEMKSFLASDATDSNVYNLSTYNCADFSRDVIDHAVKQHIRVAYVSIEFPDSAHGIIAFNTKDKGIIYIEPQSDEEVNLQINKPYYSSIIVKPGYYYKVPSYDDTVKKISLVW